MGLSKKRWARFFSLMGIGLALLFCSFAEVRADVVVFDDFDDGTLDPQWEVSLIDANGWTYSEQGSNLIVTDIGPTVINPGSGGTWAQVLLKRSFAPLTNFVLDFDFAWDSEGKLEAVQMVTLTLRSQEKIVTRVAYHDAWIAQSGEKAVRFDQTVIQSGYNTLPLQGSASIKVTRTYKRVIRAA